VVACCLWFPDAGGPLDALDLTALEPAEWAALGVWSQARAAELPALAALLSAALPVGVPPAGVPALAGDCQRVDWDALPGPALGGFAALSLVVSQAIGQAGAGLRFAADGD
jgi:hypothetical protein